MEENFVPEKCNYETCGLNGFCVPKSLSDTDLSLCICRNGFSGLRCEFAPDFQSEIDIKDLFRKIKKGKKNPNSSKKVGKNNNKSKLENEERSIASLMSIYQELKEDGDFLTPSKPVKEKKKTKNKNKKTKSPSNVSTTTKMTQQILSTTTISTRPESTTVSSTMASKTTSTFPIRPTSAKESAQKSTRKVLRKLIKYKLRTLTLDNDNYVCDENFKVLKIILARL